MGKHRIWRKIWKKLRRKRIRQIKAKLRCQQQAEEQRRLEQSPTYIKHCQELEVLAKFEEDEEKRISEIEHKKWLERERGAQVQWEELQKRLQRARTEKERQDQIIREEWEREQKLIAEKKREKEEMLEAKERKQKELETQIENFIENGGALPEELNLKFETNAGKEICPFFKKTGVCRFSDSCSRNHIKPGVSTVLLIIGFYSHFGLEQSNQNEYDTDISLEYDDEDTYVHFTEFYNDVYPEFNKYGDIINFRVCRNFEPHLRGNVYIEYENLQASLKAYRAFHGRWYGGKQLTVEFTDIPSWTSAICGLFFKNKCPKGRGCNFLHIFLNPGERYHNWNQNKRTKKNQSDTLSHCRWSESPELEFKKSKNGTKNRGKRRTSDSHDDTYDDSRRSYYRRSSYSRSDSERNSSHRSTSHSRHKKYHKHSSSNDYSSKSRSSKKKRRSKDRE